MPATSSAAAESANNFGTTSTGINPLEIVVIAVVGILFSLIIVSAFRK